MTEEKRGTGGPDSVWSVVGQNAGWGLTIAVSIGLFLWLGYVADRRLGTMPLLTIVGAFVGGGAGFYSMFRHVVVDARERRDRDGPEEPRSGGSG